MPISRHRHTHTHTFLLVGSNAMPKTERKLYASLWVSWWSMAMEAKKIGKLFLKKYCPLHHKKTHTPRHTLARHSVLHLFQKSATMIHVRSAGEQPSRGITHRGLKKCLCVFTNWIMALLSGDLHLQTALHFTLIIDRGDGFRRARKEAFSTAAAAFQANTHRWRKRGSDRRERVRHRQSLTLGWYAALSTFRFLLGFFFAPRHLIQPFRMLRDVTLVVCSCAPLRWEVASHHSLRLRIVRCRATE